MIRLVARLWRLAFPGLWNPAKIRGWRKLLTPSHQDPPDEYGDRGGFPHDIWATRDAKKDATWRNRVRGRR